MIISFLCVIRTGHKLSPYFHLQNFFLSLLCYRSHPCWQKTAPAVGGFSAAGFVAIICPFSPLHYGA